MNMKNILLAGIAASALTASGASAAIISTASVSGSVLTTTSGMKYTVSDKMLLTAGNTVTTGTTATMTLGGPNNFTPKIDGADMAYSVTFTLSGSANPTFNTTLTTTSFGHIMVGGVAFTPVAAVAAVGSTPAVAGCTVTNAAQLIGGLVGSKTVTYQFNLTGTGCTTGAGIAPTGIKLDMGAIKIAAIGDVIVTATSSYTQTSAAYDPTPAIATLIQAVPVYDVQASASPVLGVLVGGAVQLPTVHAVAAITPATNPYTSYLNASGYDAIIGSLKAGLLPAANVNASGTVAAPTVPVYFSNLSAVAAPLIAARATLTATTGTFAVITPTVVGVTFAFVDATTKLAYTGTSAAGAAGLAAVNATVAPTAANNISTTIPQSYSATVSAAPGTGGGAAALVASTAWGESDKLTVALETTGQQGTQINAPWFGGSQASTPSIVRISNTGSATGAVTLTLNNAQYKAGTAIGAKTCAAADSLAAGGELLINDVLVKNCFGDFIRGDLNIVALGSTSGLTAKMRVLSANGSVSEQTLGNISSGVSLSN